MINKRLLIKNLLSKNDENSFYDKKQKLSLHSKEGKAKFIKHICALSNSNPDNNSYIVIGVQDEDNKILGVDFYDDSKIQNLVNAYLNNPPKIEYENVHFPRLPRYKVLGLVTIYPNKAISSLAKTAWKYYKGTVFFRRGSNSIPTQANITTKNTNQPVVASLEKNSRNNIELTLNSVFNFFKRHDKIYNPQYKVFKEQFVLCWAGKQFSVNQEDFFSRVDIELINEQVKLFYSNLDDVKIYFNEHSFIITEYIILGIDKQQKHYPLEKTIINFKDNGIYHIATEFLFESPQFNKEQIQHIYNNNNAIVLKIEKELPLSAAEHKDVLKLPTSYLICYLNGFTLVPEQLKKAKSYLKNLDDKSTYIKYKEVLRVLRKIKYQ
ncbi:MAG: ATP-binding protein [Tenacibaculum sp.]